MTVVDFQVTILDMLILLILWKFLLGSIIILRVTQNINLIILKSPFIFEPNNVTQIEQTVYLQLTVPMEPHIGVLTRGVVVVPQEGQEEEARESVFPQWKQTCGT